jgi:hypothetical protein
MSKTSFCGFCQVTGFPGPHDHFVRASKDPRAKITCPRLLETVCDFCHKKGHTNKFCGEHQYAERQARESFAAMERAALDAGEWSAPSTRRSTRQNPVSQEQTSRKRAVPTSAFGALALDSSSDSEQEQEQEQEQESYPSGPTWADVAKRAPFPRALEKRPTGMSWADWAEEDE